MKIAVCIKPVYDVTENIILKNDTLQIDPDSKILNPWDEFALEAAIQIGETFNADITAISVGGDETEKGLRHALAMGVQEAVQITLTDTDLIPPLTMAKILAAAIHKIGEVDLVICGKQSADYEYGILPAILSQILDLPMIPFVSSADAFEDKKLTLTHQGPAGKQQVRSPLPLLLTINKDFAEPRFPSFMQTRKAKKIDIPKWELETLEIVDLSRSLTKINKKTARQIQFTWIDGKSPEEIAAKLRTTLEEEGVL